MKFSAKDFFSKCDQIRRKLRIWSNLLKKYFFGKLHFLFSIVIMVSNIFGKAPILKKIFMRMSGEFYLLHMVGGLRWMKIADRVEADQLDLTTSDTHIC